MNQNEEIINRFYTSFQNKDFRGMQECYSEQVVFSDPVFVNLHFKEVNAMWEMLITRGRDLTLEFSDISADEKSGSAAWIATYTFSVTGRKVVNQVHANFLFEEGKIIRHIDSFSFYHWARQALGIMGLLLGWTPIVRNKIRKTAKKNLEKFMRGR